MEKTDKLQLTPLVYNLATPHSRIHVRHGSQHATKDVGRRGATNEGLI